MRRPFFRVHPSVYFLLVYVIFLMTSRFGAFAREANVDPLRLSLNSWEWGIALALGVGLSIVTREAIRLVVAQRRLGARIQSETLTMLGGDLRIHPDAGLRGKLELKLAALGPILNLAFATLLFWIKANTLSPNTAFITHWLGCANLVMGFFNLLPALPLDGGLAFKSVQDTRLSVRVGKSFALGLAIVGAFSLNLFLLVIAGMLYEAARNESLALLSPSFLKDLTTGSVTTRVNAVDEAMSLQQAEELMSRLEIKFLPVKTQLDHPCLIGLENIRNFPRPLWNRASVRDLLKDQPRFLEAEVPLSECIARLIQSPMKALPVREDGILIGFAELEDVYQVIELRRLTAPEPQKLPGEKRAA